MCVCARGVLLVLAVATGCGAVCPPGQLDDDQDSATACASCPSGRFRPDAGGTAPPTLVSGYGNLVAHLHHDDDPCEWAPCFHNCTCMVSCNDGCTQNVPESYANGARICSVTSASSLGWNKEPSVAIDGNTNGRFGSGSCTHSESTHFRDGTDNWWQVALSGPSVIDAVNIAHRSDCCSGRNIGAHVILSQTPDYNAGVVCGPVLGLAMLGGQPSGTGQPADPSRSNLERIQCNANDARSYAYVTVVKRADVADVAFMSPVMTLCEVEVIGWMGCFPCPIGTFSGVGATSCQACPLGTVTSVDRTECIACLPGTIPATAGGCDDCAPGSYDHDGISSTPCTPCSPGFYLPTAGTFALHGEVREEACVATAAAACAAALNDTLEDVPTRENSCRSAGRCGYTPTSESNATAELCYALDADACSRADLRTADISASEAACHHSAEPGGSCEYSSVSLGSACLPCRAGTFSPLGSTECIECESGRSDLDSNAQTPCESCRAGTFATVGLAGSCLSCPPGTFSAPMSAECKACAIGKFDDDVDPATPCQWCAPGTVAPIEGSTECRACGASEVLVDQSVVVPPSTMVSRGNILATRVWLPQHFSVSLDVTPSNLPPDHERIQSVLRFAALEGNAGTYGQRIPAIFLRNHYTALQSYFLMIADDDGSGGNVDTSSDQSEWACPFRNNTAVPGVTIRVRLEMERDRTLIFVDNEYVCGFERTAPRSIWSSVTIYAGDPYNQAADATITNLKISLPSRCDCVDGTVRADTDCVPCPGNRVPDGTACRCASGSRPTLHEGLLSHCVLDPPSPICRESECTTCPAGKRYAVPDWSPERRAAVLKLLYQGSGIEDLSAPESAKTCAELAQEYGGQWGSNLEYGTDKVCAESNSGLGDDGGSQCWGGELETTTGIPHEGWAHVNTICTRIGARLCSVAEIQLDETRDSGHPDCGSQDAEWVWSRDECDGGHLAAVGSSQVGAAACSECQEASCVCTARCFEDDNQHVVARCCADTVLESVDSADPTGDILELCSDCPPGLFGNQSECTKCPVDTFASSDGMAACSQCPNGLLTATEGSADSNDCQRWVYQGCFADQVSFGVARDMTSKSYRMGQTASLETCREFCRGYDYMGLQFTDMCVCDNSFGAYGVIPDRRFRAELLYGSVLQMSSVDFVGHFKYAVDMNGPGGETVGDASFTPDHSTPGVTFQFPQSFVARPDLRWMPWLDFGEDRDSEALERMMRSLRGGPSAQIKMTSLIPGADYRLQIILWQPYQGAMSLAPAIHFGEAPCVNQQDIDENVRTDFSREVSEEFPHCSALTNNLGNVDDFIGELWPHATVVLVADFVAASSGNLFISFRGAIVSAFTVEELATGEANELPCGHEGDACGQNREHAESSCHMANAVFRISDWDCTDVVCPPGFLQADDAAAISVYGLDSDGQQSACCVQSCSAWYETNTCSVGAQFAQAVADSVAASSNASCCLTACGPGTWDNEGYCENCPAGTAALDGNGCTPCADGYYAAEASTACSPCPSGSVDDDADSSTPCVPCQHGRFASSDASVSECPGLCLAGTYSGIGSTSEEDCVDCVAGQYDDDNDSSTPCALCEAGRFKPPGSADCTPCDSPTLAGATSCDTILFIEYACPSQWLQCTEHSNCTDEFINTLTAQERPSELDPLLVSLLKCISGAIDSGMEVPSGCTDPAAVNYVRNSIIDDGTCHYHCADYAKKTGFSSAALCLFYDQFTSAWRNLGGRQRSYDSGSYIDVFADEVIMQGHGYQFLAQPVSENCRYEYFLGPLNWLDAQEACLAGGGSLAQVSSSTELDRLKNVVPTQQAVWIGLNDRQHESDCDGTSFVWGDSTRVPDIQAWKLKSPDAQSCDATGQCESDCKKGHCGGILRSTEDCVVARSGAEEWDDEDCGRVKSYVCGYPCAPAVRGSRTKPQKILGTKASLRRLYFAEMTADGNSPDSQLGAAIHASDSVVDIRYTQFADNEQHGVGSAAVYSNMSSLQVQHSSFEQNMNRGFRMGSSGIYLRDASDATLSYCTFRRNLCLNERLTVGASSASSVGISSDSSQLMVEFSRFEHNVGAATIVASESNITIISSVFSRNTAEATGSKFDSAGVAAYDSIVVIESSRFTGNVAPSGVFVLVGEAGHATLNHVQFDNNVGTGVDLSAGAVLVAAHACLVVNHALIAFNAAKAALAAGAILASESTVSLSKSLLRNNAVDPSTDGGGGAGGLYVEQSVLRVFNSTLSHNVARDDDGQSLGLSYSDAVASYSAVELLVRESVYEPFIDDETVLVFPGAVRGAIQGGCELHPCAPGHECLHTNYSLSCRRCPGSTHSRNGVVCSTCPPGTGPTAERDGCEPCVGNDHSSNGVCLPCSPALVPDDQHIECLVCGSRQTSVSGDSLSDTRACGCADGFYNESDQFSICFYRGYDPSVVETAVGNSQLTLSSGQDCQLCPSDWLGNACMECQKGAAAQVRAGYTIPQLLAEGSRRSLSAEPRGPQLVFRCHDDLEIGSIRCPGNLGQCADGYTGYLCSTCAQGYGMVHSQRCEACEQQPVQPIVVIVLILVLGIFALASEYGSRLGLTKNFLRCVYQPLRIVITYAQVISQLREVLDFTPPPVFAAVLDAIHPVIDIWGMLFQAFGSSECFGFAGFASYWMLRVVLLPMLLGLVVLLVYCIDRRRTPDKAYGNAKGSMFFCVFFVYPTVCATSFASFICRQVSATQSVLEADDTLLCDAPEHRATKLLSIIVIVLFAFGLPVLFGYVLVNKARRYARESAGMNSALARRVAEDLDVDEVAAGFVIRDVVLGEDYGFLMDAYSPQFLYWEALDMMRKLFLVGVVLLIGRGSMAQLNSACLLSFGFFALQCKYEPYKISQDNAFRALTELHVFIVILIAISLGKVDLRRELLTMKFYDWALVCSFTLLVPIAFGATVISKLRFVTHSLYVAEQGPKRAFNRLSVGLKTDDDVNDFKDYLDQLRTQVAGAQLLSRLQGAQWKSDNPGIVHHRDSAAQLPAADKEQSATGVMTKSERLVPEGDLHAGPQADISPEDSESTQEQLLSETGDHYYSKFDGGFEGTFADMEDFFGGLELLIGECRKDLMQAMEEEHTAVVEGYGASDAEFCTSSYRVVTTPRDEWYFVVAPSKVGEMSAGVDRETGRSRGNRAKLNAEELLSNAAALITGSLKELGFDLVVTDEEICNLPLLLEEVIALRLYTGPMFELYNTTLRAWGNTPRGIVPSYSLVGAGMDVRNRFTTTLHVLSSGVLKLSRLQPAMTVFRGISRMKLPKTFTEANKHNVKGGVEYGFMSTTTDEHVALAFAKDSDSSTASTLVVAKMGMVDRGASLVWLSQYPHEREILLPPLTALEVIDITDFTDDGDFIVRKVTTRLNCNLLSTTIERLLAVRKKQVQELASIVSKDIVKHEESPDICGRMKQLNTLQLAVKDQDSRDFNDNAFFSEYVGSVMNVMPKLGDQITVLMEHTQEVLGLALVDADGSFVSSAWDSTARVWSLSECLEYSSAEPIRLPAASVALDTSVGGMYVASGQFDGSIVVRKLGTSASTLLTSANSSDIITAVAWAKSAAYNAGDLETGGTTSPMLLASGASSGRILLWDLDLPDAPVHDVGNVSNGHVDTVRSLHWVVVNGQTKLVSSSFDRTIIVWRLSNPRRLEFERELQDQRCPSCHQTAGGTTAHAGGVTATDSVGELLASGSEDGTIKLWDLRNSDGPHLCVAHDHGISSLVCIPRGEHGAANTTPWKLAFGSGDNTIVICNVEGGKGEILATMRGHSGIVNALHWVETRGWLVSASADTTVRVWRVNTDTGD